MSVLSKILHEMIAFHLFINPRMHLKRVTNANFPWHFKLFEVVSVVVCLEKIKQLSTYSIKTFIQTWYNKQKQDSELMTEKKNHILFSSFNPEAHNSQSAPHVWWNRIQTGQKIDTRGREKSKGKVSPFWFYRSCICLILCNKQRKNCQRKRDRKPKRLCITV